MISGADVGGLLFPDGALATVFGELIAGQHGDVVVGRGVGEEGLEAVIVGLEDGVEFVIVAACASVRQAHEDGAGGVGHVVENLLAALLEHAGVALVGIVAVEAGGDAGLGTLGPQLVAGDLLFDEAVVGLVGVERLNYVVAVAPGVGARFVGLEAFAFGVAGEVEPVAAPTLAVLRRGEQAIYDFFESLRGVVGEEGVDFFGRWAGGR